jgi:hypothetical protein
MSTPVWTKCTCCNDIANDFTRMNKWAQNQMGAKSKRDFFKK